MGTKKTLVLFVNQTYTCVVSNYTKIILFFCPNMNYTERKAKNQVFFYITSGSGFMTPLISVLIIPGAVSTAVNMVTAMVKRICNGIEKRLLKKGQLIKTQLPF